MDADRERARIIAKHGGLSNKICIWKGCRHKALADMAMCFDHAEPDFELFVASQDPDWSDVKESDDFARSPDGIDSAEDAITLLAHAAKHWRPPLRTTGLENGKWIVHGARAQDQKPDFDQWDSQLAQFVSENTDALESFLRSPTWLDRFAYTRTQAEAESYREGRSTGGLPRSILANFLEEADPAEGEFLWRTIKALDPVMFMRFVIRCNATFRHVLTDYNRNLAMARLAKWLGEERIGRVTEELTDVAPPELVELLGIYALDPECDLEPLSMQTPIRFTPILPDSDEAIVELGPDQVSLRLANYRGVTVGKLHTLLVSQNFLAENENVGDVIVRDAKTLVNLGVSRHELAAALTKACVIGSSEYEARTAELFYQHLSPLKRLRMRVLKMFRTVKTARATRSQPYEINFMSFCGHHLDPFHSSDTYYMSKEVGGSADCTVSSKKGEIFFSDMHPHLIRRACFFEGDVQYRLDPKLACEILGLI